MNIALLNTIIPLWFFIQFNEINTKCMEYTYRHKDACYAFLRAAHVKVGRVVYLKDATENDKNSDVVTRRSIAERICSELYMLRQHTIHLTERERDELTEFTRVGKRLEPKLVTIKDEQQLKFLMQYAFGASGKREGGGAFLAGDKATSPFSNNNTVPGFNPGSCPYIFYDPFRPDFEKLIWVDCENPYVSIDEGSRNIICEYSHPKDCEWKQIYDKCQLTNLTDYCVFLDHAIRIPGDPQYGEWCSSKTNKTILCPREKESDCDQDCVWSEWTLKKKCFNCGWKEWWMRTHAKRQYGKGLDCEGDRDKYPLCPCGVGKIESIPCTILIMLLATIGLNHFLPS